MRKYTITEAKREKYKNCYLIYKLADDVSVINSDKKNYEDMQKALEAVGVNFEIKDDELHIFIFPDKYVRVKERNSGRSRKIARKNDSDNYYKYSDIVFMMQTMQDREIAERISMPIATYKRHKKTMKESNYYNSLDLNRLNDEVYLQAQPGNHIF